MLCLVSGQLLNMLCKGWLVFLVLATWNLIQLETILRGHWTISTPAMTSCHRKRDKGGAAPLRVTRVPAAVDTVPSPGVDIVQVVSPGGGYQLRRPWPGRGTVGVRCTIAPWGSPLLLPGCKLEPGETQQTEASYGNQ